MEVVMNKRTSLLFGITLIVLALLALGSSLLIGLVDGFNVRGVPFWPLLVIGAGLMFCLPPLIFNKVRGLGGLFIPGIPVLTTGLLLLASSITGNWGLWTYFWPMEVIALAVGFILAAFSLKVIWLWIPASIIGLNGLMFLFCALTGFWSSWAVLWTMEFLSVGLPLLIIGFIRKMEGLKLAGVILCAISVVSFAAMSSVLASYALLFSWMGAGLLFVFGSFLIFSALLKKPAKA